MRLMASVCGSLLAVTLLVPAGAAAQRDRDRDRDRDQGPKETETVDRTVPFPDNGLLKLRNFSGPVRISAGGGRDVVIRAVRRARRDRLDAIKLEITTSGSTVLIEANKRDSNYRERDDNVVDTEFDIRLPASAVLDVNVFSSDIDVKGITGEQKLETFSGNIVVAGGKAAVEAKTFSGKIEIDLVGAGATPDITAETFSGPIRARLAETAKGQVRFTSFSGSFDSDIPLTMKSVNRQRVTGTFAGGSGGATLHFHTFSGDVQVIK